MIMIPWSVKFIYGITSDTVPLLGSRKKSWLLIMGLLQVISCLTVAFGNAKQLKLDLVMLTCTCVSGAFMDVIVDALMVMQARKDPDLGS